MALKIFLCLVHIRNVSFGRQNSQVRIAECPVPLIGSLFEKKAVSSALFPSKDDNPGRSCMSLTRHICPSHYWGWSGGAMVLGKLPVPGRPTIWITVGQGPTALAVGAGGGCLDIFTLIYPLSSGVVGWCDGPG